jgi:hypothetical protein
MTSPRNATTKPATGKRFYSWRGEAYWSVTTIIGGGIPKPVLVNWAKKFTAEYAVDNFDKLTKLLEPDKDGNVDREAAVDWLKGAAFRDRDKKADLGSSLHVATEAYVLGKPMPMWPLPIRPRMGQFLAFLQDWEPEYHQTEASVYSRTQRYAGTLDAICTIKGRRVLLDYKSGKGVYPEVALQLAAYRYAEFIGLPDGAEALMPAVDACAVLHLPDDGDYDLIEVRADKDVFNSFLYAREVFRWLEEGSKSALLGPIPAKPADETQLALGAALTEATS